MAILIIGQGIAGTLLHYELSQAGLAVAVIDNPNQKAASTVAAGLINPITGKRLVKSWKIEALLKTVHEVYPKLESLLNINILERLQILRIFKNAEEENKWESRSGDPLYSQYFCEAADLSGYKGNIKLAMGFGELNQGAKVDMALLLERYRQYLIDRGALQEEKFDFDHLEFNGHKVLYQSKEYDQIIFCEGAAAASNPYFKYLPFQLSKGEALVVKIASAQFNKSLKHGLTIIPLCKNHYWVGATNDWVFEDDKPTPGNREKLASQLKALLDTPFEIVDHRAAIRPTIKDRRPLIGFHPKYPALGIFNGLGTKGASLAPHLARYFALHISQGVPLEEAVNIRRFE